MIRKKVLVKLACSGPFGDIECLKKSPISSFALWMIAKADRIVAVNQDIKGELLEVGLKEDKILMIPNSVDITIFKSSEALPPSKKKVVSFVRRLHDQKGVAYLIDGWKKLRKMTRVDVTKYVL